MSLAYGIMIDYEIIMYQSIRLKLISKLIVLYLKVIAIGYKLIVLYAIWLRYIYKISIVSQ